MNEIIQAWLYIENKYYHGSLTIHCNKNYKTYRINNNNNECILNVYEDKYYIGSYTHIQSFLNEYRQVIIHNEPFVKINKKRRRDEDYLID